MRKWTFSILFTSLFFGGSMGNANQLSHPTAHPLGWMHQLPVGETPGWKNRYWFHTEYSVANVWNPAIELINTDNGKTLIYEADYEHSFTIVEIGYAPFSFLGISFHGNYNNRRGGYLDQSIDSFHVGTGSHRFERPEYPKNDTRFRLETDGENSIQFEDSNALGDPKIKLKLWLFKWGLRSKGSCPCGLSASYQLKIPGSAFDEGFSSGHSDISYLLHLGVPIGKQSGLWLTAAATEIGKNDHLTYWPTRKWHQMYEASFDIGLSKHWGMAFTHRMESPFLDKKKLAIVIRESDVPESKLLKRLASPWNTLVHWRGSQSIGPRYRTKSGDEYRFLISEDWTYGDLEGKKKFYLNNAPDVSLHFQANFGF